MWSLVAGFSLCCELPLSPCAEHLNSQFVQFLLDVIEDGLPSDTTDQLPDLFVNVLLAFNLHIPGGFSAAVLGSTSGGWNGGARPSLGLRGAAIAAPAPLASGNTLCLNIVQTLEERMV